MRAGATQKLEAAARDLGWDLRLKWHPPDPEMGAVGFEIHAPMQDTHPMETEDVRQILVMSLAWEVRQWRLRNREAVA